MVSKLYIKMVKEALNEFAYSATIANLRYGVSSSKHGISLEVSGFSHKLPILLTKLAEKMVTVEVRSTTPAAERVNHATTACLTSPCVNILVPTVFGSRVRALS